MLVEVSAWERTGDGGAEPRRIAALDVPRNADVTLRVLSVEAPGLAVGEQLERSRVVLRVHTEDGGAVAWRLRAASPATAPLRAMALTRLDVVVGASSGVESARLSGPSTLAEIPMTGRLDPAVTRRLAHSVAESGGVLWMAAGLPVRAVADGAPGQTARRFVLEGASEDQGRRVARAVVVELEIGVEIVDRDDRPEERHKRERDGEEDPVHQPRPRQLTLRY